MKKIAILCVLALFAFAQTACVFQTDTHTPDCKFHTKTIDLVINQNEWKYDSQNRQFYARFDLPEITANIYNYGNYSLHREYNTGLSTAYQVALPESKFMSETVTYTDGSQGEVYYTQLVDYRIGVGYVEIQVTNSDFYYTNTYGNLIYPESMNFRLQLIY